MGLMDKLSSQIIDIITWTEPPESDILAYRFPRYDNTIKMGAKLTVREGQAAVFVNEGQIADVFKPGMYTLETPNMPILSTLKGWRYGFNSPFKAEVYFIAMRQFTDLKWGTPNPIMMRDPEFGPVRIRAFGTYAMHVSDPAVFLRQIVATNPSFESFQISGQMRDTIVSRFTDVLGQAKIPVLDLAGNYDKVSGLALTKIKTDLATMGVELTLFYVENISLPPEVEQALDTRTKMGLLGDLNQYTKYESAQAISEAARNTGGIAGMGAGFGAGMVISGQMASQAAAANQAPQPGSPPPLPSQAESWFVALNGAQSGPFDAGALTQKIQSGNVTRDTLVWKQGMSAWSKAGTQPELANLFSAVPPPLPTP